MSKDHFKRCPLTGKPYAGDHLIMDIYGADPKVLTDVEKIQSIMRQACLGAGATVLDEYYHSFGSGMGVSGATILAESHATIHTWPEYGYASVDIFMCGSSDPRFAALYIKSSLLSEDGDFCILRRGPDVKFDD